MFKSNQIVASLLGQFANFVFSSSWLRRLRLEDLVTVCQSIIVIESESLPLMFSIFSHFSASIVTQLSESLLRDISTMARVKDCDCVSPDLLVAELSGSEDEALDMSKKGNPANIPAETQVEKYKRPPGVTTLVQWGELKFPEGVYRERNFVTVLVEDPEYCRRVASRKARSAWLKSFQQYMIAVRNVKSVTLLRKQVAAEEAEAAAAASAAAKSKTKPKAKALSSKEEEDNWAFIPSQPSTPLRLVPRIPLFQD